MWIAFFSQLTIFAPSLSQSQSGEHLSKLYLGLKHQIKEENSSIVAITLVNKNCRCNRFLSRAVEQIEQTGTVHKIVDIAQLQGLFDVSSLIPSTPALLVLSKEFKTASYYGPHNDGLMCGQGESLLPMVKSNLLNNFNPEWVNSGSTGCYCDT